MSNLLTKKGHPKFLQEWWEKEGHCVRGGWWIRRHSREQEQVGNVPCLWNGDQNIFSVCGLVTALRLPFLALSKGSVYCSSSAEYRDL